MKNINKSCPVNIDISFSLKGKKILVSGGASGIGRAIALCFAAAGSELIIIDIDKNGMDEVGHICREQGSQVDSYHCDLSLKDNIDRFWENLGKDLPDILVNNAGIYPFKDYLEVDQDFYHKTLDVNLNSVFWMCQNFIKRRGKKGGVIVNISSIEAMVAFKEDLSHYSISKAGVIALTKALARDYGKKGFRVNSVLPGAIKTPGTDYLVKDALKNVRLNLVKTGLHFNSRLSLGRWGRPEEVARVVLFLASDLASYVQGAMIPVDGGFLAS